MFTVLIYYQYLELFLFIKTRTIKVGMFKLISRSILGVGNFIINLSIGVLLLYLVYNRISNDIINRTIIFLIMLLLRASSILESVLHFFLKLSFDELENLSLQLTAFGLKFGTIVSIILEVVSAFKHPNESIIEITKKAFESTFG